MSLFIFIYCEIKLLYCGPVKLQFHLSNRFNVSLHEPCRISATKLHCFNDSIQSVFLLFCLFNRIAYKGFSFQGDHSFLVILETIVKIDMSDVQKSCLPPFTFFLQNALELHSQPHHLVFCRNLTADECKISAY